MNNIFNKRRYFFAEYFVIAYNLFALLIILFVLPGTLSKWVLVILHVLTFCYIVVLGRINQFNKFRIFFPVLLIPLFFNELHLLIPFTKFLDWDIWLIEADRAIFFGLDPAIFISKYAVSPFTDFFQLVYTTFYFLPIFVLIGNSLSGKTLDLINSVRVLTFGFLLSYLGYFLISALGPRFYLEKDFLHPLIGGDIYWFIHHIINDLEMINWDAFPSGHTEIAILSGMLAYRSELKFRIFYWIFAFGIIISTVYLRYHYFLDVFAGILLAGIVWKLNEKWHRFDLENWINENEIKC